MHRQYWNVYLQDTMHQVPKDDESRQTRISYYCLLVLFTMLMVFGLVNVYLAQKIRKFSRPIVTFYLVSEMVIVLRILLFMDALPGWEGWPDASYVILFITMPSYLYLLVGCSQVMLTLESIFKYKNFKLREE